MDAVRCVSIPQAQWVDMSTHHVGIVIGSLSKDSINRKLARAVQRLAADRLNFTEIEIGDLPLYNRDLDGDFPAPARRLKDEFEGVQALLLVTPEYNRAVPAALVNALEWASRPYGQNAMTGKPSAVIGASPGGIGTAVAQRELRGILTYSDAPQLQRPELYFQFREGVIDDDGQIHSDGATTVLTEFVDAFVDFLDVRLG